MGPLHIDRCARFEGWLVLNGADILASCTYVADRPWARAVGMLGTPDPAWDDALILIPCSAVHGVGLRARIGAAFIDSRGVVLRVVDPLPRRGARVRGACAVVEARSGVLSDVRPGDRLQVSGGRVFPLGGDFGDQQGGAFARLMRCPVTGGTRPRHRTWRIT